MLMGFSHLSRWLWGKKEKGAASSVRAAANSHGSPMNRVPPVAAVPQDSKDVVHPKWQSDGWVVDREYDLVMVPDDVRRLSDADEVDWSIGWFEPHASKFLSDREVEKSFAVLVPCYRPRAGPGTPAMGNAKTSISGVVAVYEDNKYLDEFLSSLQSS